MKIVGMAFSLALSLSINYCFNPKAPPLSSPSTNPFLSKLVFPCNFSPETSTHLSTLHHPHCATSPQGIPGELVEDSKFVPLNADDPVYGPPVSYVFALQALLLLGFELDEAAKIQELLRDMGGEFMQIIFCTEEMIPQSLWKAMHTSQPNLDAVKIAKSVPRICFLSGLSGEEMIMFIDAFPEAGLDPAVFAAVVPNSADKPVEELIEEIMGDHEILTSNQSDSP